MHATVVGWGRNRCIMLIMTLLKLWGGVSRESRERARERERRCLHHKSPDDTDTSSVM